MAPVIEFFKFLCGGRFRDRMGDAVFHLGADQFYSAATLRCFDARSHVLEAMKNYTLWPLLMKGRRDNVACDQNTTHSCHSLLI